MTLARLIGGMMLSFVLLLCCILLERSLLNYEGNSRHLCMMSLLKSLLSLKLILLILSFNIMLLVFTISSRLLSCMRKKELNLNLISIYFILVIESLRIYFKSFILLDKPPGSKPFMSMVFGLQLFLRLLKLLLLTILIFFLCKPIPLKESKL